MTSLLYSGEKTDLTGLQYLRARYYDLATGTFNRLDPFFGNLKDPLSLHKYLYAQGDAVNDCDPSGLWSLSVQLATIGNYALKGLTALSAIQVGYEAATQRIGALTFWDWLGVLPLGYIGAGARYARGMRGLRAVAVEHPQIVRILPLPSTLSRYLKKCSHEGGFLR